MDTNNAQRNDYPDYGSRFIAESYTRLVGLADRLFGGLAIATLIFAAYGWSHGQVPGLGVLLSAIFIGVNLLMSALAKRVIGKHRVRIELVRIFAVNGLICPAIYLSMGRAHELGWPGYFIGTMGAAIVLGTAFPHTPRIGVLGILFWSLNLAFTGLLGLDSSEYSVLALQSGTLLVIGSIFLKYTSAFIEQARIENEGFEKALARLKGAQAQLIESGKLAALGQMAGGIAHEINSPLATIQVAARQIARAADAIPPQLALIHDRAALVQTVTERIARIVAGLRSFCRDGGLQESLKSVPVESIVSDTLVFCEEKFKAAGVKLEVSVDKHLEMECRSVQISQVLLNLLNNAYDAVKARPERAIKLHANDSGSMIRIRVQDSGPGIPDSVRPRIFDPFFTTKAEGTGTGLGLSISKRIIEVHGGKIALCTEAMDTTFVIDLPKQQSAGPASPIV